MWNGCADFCPEKQNGGKRESRLQWLARPNGLGTVAIPRPCRVKEGNISDEQPKQVDHLSSTSKSTLLPYMLGTPHVCMLGTPSSHPNSIVKTLSGGLVTCRSDRRARCFLGGPLVYYFTNKTLTDDRRAGVSDIVGRVLGTFSGRGKGLLCLAGVSDIVGRVLVTLFGG